MQLFLGVTPREYREAGRYTRNFAHIAYRIGEDSSLLRQELLMNVRGGMAGISDREAPSVDDPAALAEAVVRECGRRGFTGVLLDFEGAPRPDLAAFAGELVRQLREPVYLPETWAAAVPGAVPLVCTALSGGSFARYLRDRAAAWGGTIALDVERLRMDFSLPSPTGAGTPLTAGQFRQLVQEENPPVFFSPELCARYFTYRRDGAAHFVLFDAADTLNRKLQLGRSLQLPAAFLMWPEVSDLAPQLFRSRQG